MSNATPIQVPLENVNDETVRLLLWMVAEGEQVREGQPIAELETSKAVIELVSPGSGFITFAVRPGEEVSVGAVVGHVGSQQDVSQPTAATRETTASKNHAIVEPAKLSPVSGVRFSRKALELIEREGVSPDLFAGQAMVRESDVLAFLQSRGRDVAAGQGLHRALAGISLTGVTLPAGCGTLAEGRMEESFLRDLRADSRHFAGLSSAAKCKLYSDHGASIGQAVAFGEGALVIAPQIVLRDKVRIGDHARILCSERFVAGQLTSFQAGLSLQGATVVLGENIYAGSQIEISSNAKNPLAVLYVGDTTFLGDQTVLDISRPVIIGKEVFVAQRAVLITHNIGHSILDGFENRFEPVVLEDRSQVGINATIYAGSRIGDSAVVASNSYVISSIPAGKLAIGVPARVVRDVARQPSRNQQLAIARQMVEDFREALHLRGFPVSPVSEDRFTLEHEAKSYLLAFVEDDPSNTLDAGSFDSSVIWTLQSFTMTPSNCFVVDLKAKTIRGPVNGETNIFADSAREYLRKRGIRCEPGPWRYAEGLI